MTFKDVAIKNFKANIKRYLMCFLCSSFSIMTIFMYATVLFNEDIITTDGNGNGFDLLLYISMIAVVVFSIFFINYANNAFIKSRYKEFGVMMTLGMSKSHITKLICLENVIIILSSLTIGICTGSIFSRLFQMVVIDILGLEGINYSIGYKSFLLTIAVFLLIFLVQLVLTIISIKKFSIEELIKKERENEGRLNAKLLPGVIGVTVTFLSMAALIFIGNSDKLRENMALSIGTIIVIFIGIYIVISSLGMLFLALIRSIPKVYNKNIIEVTNLNKKFNSQKRVIFILTMLTALTIFAIAPPLSLMNETATVVDLNKYDLEIGSIFGLNQLDEGKIEEIARKHDIQIEKNNKFEFIALNFITDKGGTDISSNKPIISQSEYNLNSDKKVEVNEGDAINIITGWLPDNGGVEVGDIIYFKYGNESIDFNIKDTLRTQWICSDRILPTRSVVVLNDKDYNKIKNSADKSAVGYCYQWKLSKWKNQDEFVAEVKENLVNEPTDGGQEYLSFSDMFLYMSKPDLYNEMKQGYKFFVFICTIMGILFFISSASVLFFNQYVELEESKKRFNKLYKIGVLKKEVKKIVSKELLVTFFTPVFIGSILATVLMNFTAKVMGGEDMISEFMSSSMKVMAIYIIFQIIFYIFTRRSYIKKILNQD